MKIRIADFKGEIPRFHPRILPQNFATSARNTRLDDGTIAPVRQSGLAHTLASDADTIFLHKGTWQSFSGDVDVVPGPVADDRLYLTGSGAPKMRVSGTDYNLALPAPSAAPNTSLSGTIDEEVAQFVTYAYTFVTSFDEESAPSPVSSAFLWSAGQVVTVSGFSAPVSGRSVDRIRLYRSITSGIGITDLYFVAEFPIGTSSYAHDVEADPLQEVLPSADYDPPPSTMSGLISMPNGMMAAFDGKEVLFSEPFRPHAWPEKYRLTVDADVVALASFASTLVILTTASPYIATGTHPSSMVMERMERDLPCLSKRGVVDFGYSAAYPSNEGLVIISGNAAQTVSQNLFTAEQWREINPSSFRAARYDNRYFFAYSPLEGGQELGIMDLTGTQLFYIQSDDDPEALHFDPVSGGLYFVEGGRFIYEWDAPSQPLRAQIWRSRRFQLVSPVSYAGILVETDPAIGTMPAGATPCTTRIYADGSLVHTTTKINEPARLPGGFRSKAWEIEIEGYVPVTGISMAQSYDDLSVA
ncbi:hypothetical protein RAZWK3B_16680 [Roseobacter sp. AzwK-3b]|uniref:hypothetical protein n=1 Tax=Roseobacter sp. AzwK-3b TaxID=351016 RepID=UPI0001569888|nr:hypothetical protein [Roseobacter sp. AzwK-3b]EDM71051.1 hypothetical protein RAZWK3B_16680 [Roseobacter sp. AzwK-3b]